LNEVEDSLGGRNRASLEMHLEAVIERDQRCTCSAKSNKFGDARGGCDCAYFEALIGGVW
jgi:hypothetical protein